MMTLGYRMAWLFGVCLALPALPLGVAASVTLDTSVRKIATADGGNGTLAGGATTGAARLASGDVLRYTIRVRSTGMDTASAAGELVVTNPIPAHTVYVPGSASGDGTRIEVSLDGGETWRRARSSRSISPERYTHLRWTFENPVRPGETARLAFSAAFQ